MLKSGRALHLDALCCCTAIRCKNQLIREESVRPSKKGNFTLTINRGCDFIITLVTAEKVRAVR